MTVEEEKNDNITLTLIFQMFEVINRCIDLNIDNPSVKLIIGNDFDLLVKKSRELSAKYDEFVGLDNRFTNPDEVFQADTDNLYNLILSTKGLKKNWQWKKVFKSIKQLTK